MQRKSTRLGFGKIVHPKVDAESAHVLEPQEGLGSGLLRKGDDFASFAILGCLRFRTSTQSFARKLHSTRRLWGNLTRLFLCVGACRFVFWFLPWCFPPREGLFHGGGGGSARVLRRVPIFSGYATHMVGLAFMLEQAPEAKLF